MNDNITNRSPKKKFRERPVSCNVFGPDNDPDDLDMCNFINFFPSMCSNSSMYAPIKTPTSKNFKIKKCVQNINKPIPKTSFIMGPPNSRSLENFRTELRNILYLPYNLIYQKLEKLIPEIGRSNALDTRDRIKLANVISFFYYTNFFLQFAFEANRPILLLRLALNFEIASNRHINIKLDYLNNVNTIFYFIGVKLINLNGNEMTEEETYLWRITYLEEREKMMGLDLDIFLTDLGL